MTIRDVLTRNKLGTYSELAVALAFIARGCDVTLPIGNQAGWDLLVQIEGTWQRLQVRTVRITGCAPVLNIQRRAGRHGESRGRLTAADTDFLVGLDPDSGAIWMVPAAEFGSSAHVPLEQKHLIQGSVVEPVLPRSRETNPIEVQKRNTRWALERKAMKDKMPFARPAEVSEENWVITQRWLRGEGYAFLGVPLGITACAVRERIMRVLARCGLVELPEAMTNATRYRRRRKAIEVARGAAK